MLNEAQPIVPPGNRLIRDARDIRISDMKPGKVNLLGIPWDWSVSGRPGSRYAPSEIRRFLMSLTPHAPGRGSDLEFGIRDLGDVNVAPGDARLTQSRVVKAARIAYEARLAVFLGGDHSITRWTLEPLIGEGLGVLVMDSHYDLRQVTEGVTSGSWLGEILEDHRGDIDVVVVGVADYINPPYLAYRARELGVTVIPALDIQSKGLEKALEAIDRLRERGYSNYYISVDMDHLAEAWAPGVNSPAPLGLDPIVSLRIIEHAASALSPRGFDVVEVVPAFDVGGRTSRLAAALILHLIHTASGAW